MNTTDITKKVLREGIANANRTGYGRVVLNGYGIVDELPEISQHRDTYFPKLEGTLEIDCSKAEIQHSNVGTHVFSFEGVPNANRHFSNRIILHGGRFRGNGTSSVAVAKYYDCNLAVFSPYDVQDFIYGSIAGVRRYWSEWNSFGGHRNIVTRFANCASAYRFMDIDATASFDNKYYFPKEGTKGDSHARTRISHTHVTAPRNSSQQGIVVESVGAALYGSTIKDCGGNVPNGGGSLFSFESKGFRNLMIRDCDFEGANDKDQSWSDIVHCSLQWRPKKEWQIQTENVNWSGGRSYRMSFHGH